MKTANNYWFTIDPYVCFNITNESVLLYNTLDGVSIKSNEVKVITLLQEVLKEGNCGVVLLKKEQYDHEEIKMFIRELREKYMGDIIDISLSKAKPIQILPHVNYSLGSANVYDFLKIENLLQTLFEISIYVDNATNVVELTKFLRTIPDSMIFNIFFDLKKNVNSYELFFFLNQYSSLKNILCPYTHVVVLESIFNNNFYYKISVSFPLDIQQWDESFQLLTHQDLPFGYVFNVTSLEDCQEAELLVEQYQIGDYHLNPVYTGDNIEFFKNNVFLTEEDILSTSMSMRDFFIRQSMNKHDFGKINILSNGNVYANINQAKLGNIYVHSIVEIIQKEIEEGKSWLRIRDQMPCLNCIYRWLCPSPSDYEIAIGRPNLCFVK